MANGEIVPNWDEWRNLTNEQKEYSLYRTLASMDKKLLKDECDLCQHCLYDMIKGLYRVRE